MYQVLEPERDSGSDSAFVVRDGTTYTLRLNADLWLDSEQFAGSIREATKPNADKIACLEKAIGLYRGEYLPEILYETWAAEERERLSTMFLEAADRLSDLYLQQGKFTEAIDLCQRVLTQDNCWERAYRHLMLAYHHLGDRGQIGRMYQRCLQTLREELDVSPSPETQELYEKLTNT